MTANAGVSAAMNPEWDAPDGKTIPPLIRQDAPAGGHITAFQDIIADQYGQRQKASEFASYY